MKKNKFLEMFDKPLKVKPSISYPHKTPPRFSGRPDPHLAGFSNSVLKKFKLPNFNRKNDWDFDGVPDKKDCQPWNPLRQDYTPATRKRVDDMTAAERFGARNIARMQQIGKGRDRVVYGLDKKSVLKIATNPKGLQQNIPEKELSQIGGPEQFEWGKDYVVMQRAEPPGSATTNLFRRLRKYGVSPYERERSVLSTGMEKAGADPYVLNYEVSMHDYMAKRNWGEIEGKPVLVDAGTLDKSSLEIPHDPVTFRRQSLVRMTSPEWEEIKRKRKEFAKKGHPAVRVVEKSTGAKGVIRQARGAPPEYHEGESALFTVEYKGPRARGYNVKPSELDIENPQDIEFESRREESEEESAGAGMRLLYEEHPDHASIEKQQEWQEKDEMEKDVDRITEPNTDYEPENIEEPDLVPDEYDCDKDDPGKQDFGKMSGVPIADYPKSFGYRRKLVHMSPDEYIEKSWESHGKEQSGFITPERYERANVFPSNMESIKAGLHLKKGVVPVPWLETKEGKLVGQEGRHRAVAAREMGYKEIPVHIVETDKGFIKQQEILNPDVNIIERKDIKKEDILQAYHEASEEDREERRERSREHMRWKRAMASRYEDDDFIEEQIEEVIDEDKSFADDVVTDEDDDVMIAAADNDDTNPDNPSGAHFGEDIKEKFKRMSSEEFHDYMEKYMKEQRQKEQEKWNIYQKELSKYDNPTDKAYAALKLSAQRHRQKVDPAEKERTIYEAKKALTGQPYGKMAVVTGIKEGKVEAKPIKTLVFDEEGAGMLAREMSNFMDSMFLEDEAKEMLARDMFGKEYYYELTPAEKRKTLYYIRKHAVSPLSGGSTPELAKEEAPKSKPSMPPDIPRVDSFGFDTDPYGIEEEQAEYREAARREEESIQEDYKDRSGGAIDLSEDIIDDIEDIPEEILGEDDDNGEGRDEEEDNGEEETR